MKNDNAIDVAVSSNLHMLQAEVSPLLQDIQVGFGEHFIYAFSPSAKVEQLQSGNYLITITDKDGTTTAEVPVIDEQTIDLYLNNYFQKNPIIEQAITEHNQSIFAHPDIRNSIEELDQKIDSIQFYLTWGEF